MVIGKGLSSVVIVVVVVAVDVVVDITSGQEARRRGSKPILMSNI